MCTYIGLSPFSEHTVLVQACNSVGCVNSSTTVGRTQQAGGYLHRSLSYSEHTVLVQACNSVGCVNSSTAVGRTQQAGGYLHRSQSLLRTYSTGTSL